MRVVSNSTVFYSRPNSSKSDIEEKTYDFLEKCKIDFSRIDHEPANTISDCHEIEKFLNADICKNLFLKNSAKTQYYLLLMDGCKKFDSKVISHQIGSTRLSFASADDLLKYLNIQPGSVSIMGLINDENNSVKVLIDSGLLEKKFFCCHPCKNTSTLKFCTEDIINRFLPATNHTFTVVNI